LAKVFAAKLKLKSMKKVFKKFGSHIVLTHPNIKKLVDFSPPNFNRTPKKFITNSLLTPLNLLNITE